MVKHIILWNLKDEFTPEERENIRLGIKEGLESLQGKIEGLIDIKVNINGLVHDELVLEVSEKDRDECMKMVKEEMENAVILSLPLTVDVTSGKNWLEQE